MFTRLIDLTLVNAWLLYKRTLRQQGKSKEILNQIDFRLEVAKCMCSVNCTNVQEIQIKKKKGPAQHIPPKDIRRDQIDHWAIPLENKMLNHESTIPNVELHFV